METFWYRLTLVQVHLESDHLSVGRGGGTSSTDAELCVRSHMLQADSEEQCQAWIQAIQAGVSKAYTARHSADGLV